MVSQHWWVVGLTVLSLLLAVGWSWFGRTKPDSQTWPALEKQWVGRTAQILYFVGIPYVAVVSGTLPPRLLGLKGLEHFTLIDFQTEAVIAQIRYAIALMLLDWFVDVGMSVVAGLAVLVVLGSIWISLARIGIEGATNFRASMLGTVCYSLHWAFYWANFWLLTGDLYLGVVLGTILVILEWGLIVQVQKGRLYWQQPFLVNTIILILSGVVFFYSPNLWLLWPIHILMITLVTKLSTPRSLTKPMNAEYLLGFPNIL